jgi:hypothetical protein
MGGRGLHLGGGRHQGWHRPAASALSLPKLSPLVVMGALAVFFLIPYGRGSRIPPPGRWALAHVDQLQVFGVLDVRGRRQRPEARFGENDQPQVSPFGGAFESSDSSLIRAGSTAKQVALGEFSWDRSISSLKSLYEMSFG